VRIPYRGVGPAVVSLIGGGVHMMFATAAAVSSHVKSNKLKALAITSAQASTLFPGVPTVASSGLPGYEFTDISGLFAPAKTRLTIINRLNQEMVNALDKPDVKENFLKINAEPLSSSPQQFEAKIKSEMVRLARVINEVGLRKE
jgi:tripartite-type tricarboxylate transporter receptor subunit TctC